jgi:hypothetical protein
MSVDSAAANADEPVVLCHWTARKMEPITLVGVVLVFLAFMALSLFVFHSVAAVKALAAAAVASLVPLVPAVLNRIEYRLTERELASRTLDPKKPRDFKRVFMLDELSHIVPTRHGFKFFKALEDPSPLRRFWKTHISEACSGEVHVETADQKRVLGELARRGVSVKRKR